MTGAASSLMLVSMERNSTVRAVKLSEQWFTAAYPKVFFEEFGEAAEWLNAEYGSNRRSGAAYAAQLLLSTDETFHGSDA